MATPRKSRTVPFSLPPKLGDGILHKGTLSTPLQALGDGVALALETLETALGWKGARAWGDPLPERVERAACASMPSAWPSFAPAAQRREIAQALESLRVVLESAAETAERIAQGAERGPERIEALETRDALRALRLLSLGWKPERACTGWQGYSAPWDGARGARGQFVQTLAQALESQAWSEAHGNAQRYPSIRELDAWHGKPAPVGSALVRPGAPKRAPESGEGY